MKKFILIFIIFISQYSHAQYNFFQTGATWGYLSTEWPDVVGQPYRTWLTQYQITGDTSINSIQYKTICYHNKETDYHNSLVIDTIIFSSYCNLWFRFDSLNNRVYFYNSNLSIEQLAYDFELTVGDTIPSINSSSITLVVDTIELINFFGYTVKKFILSEDTSGNSSVYCDIIEGMGGSAGLISQHPWHPSFSAYFATDLICFQLGNNVFPSGSVCDVFAGIEQKDEVNSILIYPNPYVDNFQVRGINARANSKLIIYDFTGREIYYRNIRNNQAISDFNLTGIFYWEIISEDGVVCGKLIHTN